VLHQLTLASNTNSPQPHLCYASYHESLGHRFPLLHVLACASTYLDPPQTRDNTLGNATIVQQTRRANNGTRNAAVIDLVSPYPSVSTSLDFLLALMIVIRAILDNRVVHTPMGAPGIRRVHKTIVITLNESPSLYDVDSMAIGLRVTGSSSLEEVQVRDSSQPRHSDG